MATKNIFHNQDLNGNQILNFNPEHLASDPSSPFKGRIWFNTTDNQLRVYDGSAVVNLSGLSEAAINALIATAQTTLQGNIDAEAASRVSGDNTLDAKIDQEIADRGTAVTNEASARSSADTTLQSNIDAEATARANADTALSGRLDSLEGDSSTAGSVAKAVADLEASLKGAVSGSLDDLGKVETAINNLNTLVASDTATLDTIQEIVDYIKLNRSDLDALGISGIAGLQAALDSKIDTAGTGLEKSGQTLGIADGGVDTAQLSDSAVETAKINDGAVTVAKLGSEFGSHIENVVLSDNASGVVLAANHGKGSDVNAKVLLGTEEVGAQLSIADNGDVSWAIGLNGTGSTAGKVVVSRNL